MAQAWLFPEATRPAIYVLAQIGLVLYMFLVGLEFNPKLLRNLGHAAFLTSHVSISVPFLMGAMLALYLYPLLSGDNVPFVEFALFMGAAMSVTAFPVLARILSERNLLRTKVGAVTLACAAVDDVTAWSMLAFIVAVSRAGSPVATVRPSLSKTVSTFAGSSPFQGGSIDSLPFSHASACSTK